MGNEKESRPFFSVVLTVYNGIPFLTEAIESVMAQTLKDWELIIMNDASTDGTQKVLDAYASRDARIRVFQNPRNLHIAASANAGIAAARGQWIARIDADDRYRPRFLERIADGARRAMERLSFISAWVSVIDDRGEKILDAKLPDGGTVRRMMPLENFIYHAATAFPRPLWAEVGGYPEDRRTGIDRGLWIKFFDAGATLDMIPEVLVDYRVHYGNLTSVARAATEKSAAIRQNREWRISLYLKQKMPAEARKELRLLAREIGLSPKNRLYLFLTYLPPSFVYFLMWEVRSRLRVSRFPTTAKSKG